MSDLAAQFKTLSPQTQEALKPFTLPPYHSGSWWDAHRQMTHAPGTLAPQATRLCDSLGSADVPLLTDWRYADSPGGKVRVWWQNRYPSDETVAKDFATNVDAAWVILKDVLKREPLSDGGGLRPCRGGDDRLDISLVDLDPAYGGLAYPYDSSNGTATPSYLLIDRTRGNSRGVMIHELMHAFQNAFAVSDHKEYRWWKEATTNWAVHYVETLDPTPDTNFEHGHAPFFLKVPEVPLEVHNQASHQYGAYLYPFFITQVRSGGKGDFVRLTWERAETMRDSLENLNSNVLGGFMEHWPEFAVRNLNRRPVDDYFKLDKLADEVKLKWNVTVQMNGERAKEFEMDGQVVHLSSHAYRFHFNDGQTRAIRFENPFADGDWPTASVRAVFKLDGQWFVQDWTGLPYRTFCRDQKADRLEELTLVFSNSEFKNRTHVLMPSQQPKLSVTNVACGGWKVDAEVSVHAKGEGFEQDDKVTTTGAILKRFMGTRELAHVEYYEVHSGTAKWTSTATYGACSGSGDGSYEVTNLNVKRAMTLETYNRSYFDPSVVGSRKYMALGAMASHLPSPKIKLVCPEFGTFELSPIINTWLQTDRTGGTPMSRTMSADGQTLEGEDTWSLPSGNGHVSTFFIKWKMTALPPE